MACAVDHMYRATDQWHARLTLTPHVSRHSSDPELAGVLVLPMLGLAVEAPNCGVADDCADVVVARLGQSGAVAQLVRAADS